MGHRSGHECAALHARFIKEINGIFPLAEVYTGAVAGYLGIYEVCRHCWSMEDEGQGGGFM